MIPDLQTNDPAPYRLGRWVAEEDWPVWLLLAASLAAGALLYPGMPERMPVHWNLHGEVDGYGTRFTGVLLFPLFAAGVYLLLLLVPFLDPKGRNYARFRPTFRVLRLSVVVFMILAWGISLAAAKGAPIRMERTIPALVSLLFIVLGNFMGRIRPNWFMGIRTPWTLSSETVWRATHRLGGRVFVLGGFVGLLASLFGGPASSVLFLSTVAAMTLVPVVYSYILWKREQPPDQNG